MIPLINALEIQIKQRAVGNSLIKKGGGTGMEPGRRVWFQQESEKGMMGGRVWGEEGERKKRTLLTKSCDLAMY